MTWEIFYATCFAVGLLLSVFSFLAGALHVHIPRGLHLHAGGFDGNGAGGHGHAGHAHAAHNAARGARGASYFNFGTITAFLAWFGGTGYLLTRYSGVWALLAFTLASISGLAGASVVFWFLFKVLLAHDRDLDPADYDMVGVLGRVSCSVREGGTGEMIFSQQGIRRASSVRSETGEPIPRGTEVIVTGFKDGIAYVRPWDELSQMSSASEGKL